MSVVGFSWWIGVVEDRFDPLEAGRVRVRVHGYHTQDKTQIPTNSLPWAQIIMPPTSASNSGVSETHNLIEGSHVVGFFLDGNQSQQPIIMGSISGIPQSLPNIQLGFNDPNGLYPREESIDIPDVSVLARGKEAETHPVIASIRDARIENIPQAKAASIQSIVDDKSDSDYTRQTWNQPNIRFGSEENSDRDYSNGSKYGFNQVTEYESGHFREVDNTPNAERLCTAHRKGTYEEIYSDGSKVIRVVGNGYDITIGDKKCLINGTCSVTINGDSRVLVKGNKYEEVLGDYHLHVKGDTRTKIEGSEAKEVIGDKSTQVNGNESMTVSQTRTDTVKQDATYTVGNDLTWIVSNDLSSMVSGDVVYVAGNKMSLVSSGVIDIGSSSNVNIASNSSLNFKSVGEMKMETGANFDLKSSGTLKTTSTGVTTIKGSAVITIP